MILSHLRQYPEIDDISVIHGTTPFNRYLEAEHMRHDAILTQDDDVITDVRPLLDAFVPGSGVIVNAMTEAHAAQYQGAQTLLGFGAIFDRALIRCFDSWEKDALFYRESDRIFGTIHPHRTVYPKIEILPHAHAPNRLWKQPDHIPARFAMEQRIYEKTGIRA